MKKKVISEKEAAKQQVINAIINLIAPSVDAEGRKQSNANRIITAAQYAPSYKIEGSNYVIDKEASCKMPSKVTIDGKTISLNLSQYKEIRASIALHCNICAKVVAIYNHIGRAYPITYLVYHAINKQAHRKEFYDAGIKTIAPLSDTLNIAAIATAYSRYNGNKGVDGDLLHGIVKYYAETGISAESFIDDVLPHVKKNNSEGCEQTFNFCMEATKAAGLIVEDEAPAMAEVVAQ